MQPTFATKRRSAVRSESVRNEDLRVDDMVEMLGWKRIVEIRPYNGPLTDIIFAIAETDQGASCSLERGGYTLRR